MKKTLATLTLLGLLSTPISVLAEPIKSIEILGLNAISRGTVLSYLPVETGDDYNEAVSNQIIKSLYKTGFFKDIEVSQVAQTLRINIQENPHIKYVDVLNYSDDVIDEEALNRILKSMDLTQGQIFNQRQLNQFIDQLKATYVAEGYYGIQIKHTTEIDAQNRIGVEVDVNEGEVAKITSMKILGAQVKEAEDLLDHFDLGEPDFFIMNYFTEKDHFSKNELDAGVEAMKSEYINSGYLDFKVDRIKTELSDNKEHISIEIQVSEGAQYKVGRINFSGELLNQSVDELNQLVGIKTGDVFDRKLVIKGIQAVTDVFADQGYAFAKIDPITRDNKQTHEIDITVDIDLNKRVYVNRITIVGNTRTQDEVIRREIGIVEGGLYSNSELDESIKRIKRLGFFSDVNMEVVRLKEFKDRINLNFRVSETKTGTFSIGLAHSNSAGASFNMGIKEENFLGTGNTLNAALSNSSAVQETSFYFSDPYFTEDKHSISYGIFSKSIDGSELDVASYKIDEDGFNLGYGIPVSESTRIGAEVRASSRDITCGTTFASTHEPTQCASGDKTEVKLNLNWSSNTLNDFNYPTEGGKNALSFDLALPIADFRYYKLDASHKSYYPVADDLTWTVKGNLGLAQGYGDKDLPFFKRYYGGGSSSVRGFDFNSLGATYTDGKAKGGELSMLASTAIISPMKFIKDNSDTMRLSAFVDMGSIEEKAKNFGVDEVRASTGVAFSWLTPVGPIGIYAATPLIKKTGDQIKNVEFTLGTSF